MRSCYTLEGKTPIRCEDNAAWKSWLSSCGNARIVGDAGLGGARVLTEFLGTHENHFGAPLLFETSVKGGRLDGMVERYATWEEAEQGHLEIIQKAR